jgi:hypothetical protein
MWQHLIAISIALSALVSLVSMIKAVSAARAAHQAWASVHRRLSSVESEQTSIAISVTKWTELTAELANSLKMTKIRRGMSIPDKRIGFDGEPDAAQDPEAWRTWMNAKLRADKFRG